MSVTSELESIERCSPKNDDEKPQKGQHGIRKDRGIMIFTLNKRSIMACRLACGVCLVFSVLQVFLVATLGGHSWKMERESRQVREMEAQSGSTRHLLHIISSQQEELETSPETYEGWRTVGCEKGHIRDLKKMCPSQECLPRLDLNGGRIPGSKAPRKRVTERDPTRVISEEAQEDMAYLRGVHHQAHFPLVSTLTDLQWIYGVFGSLLEIGVGEGKFSNVLTFNVDHNNGEKLVFSDSFMHGPYNSYGGQQMSVFLETMHRKNVTFSDEVLTGQLQAYMHTNYPINLNVEELKQNNIPQFRMVSINSYGDPVRLLMHLRNAICLIRDGAIIIVDDFDKEDIQETMSHFLKSLGPSSIVPLLRVHNKLYLCTANWQSKYLNLLRDRSAILDIDIDEASRVGFCGGHQSIEQQS